VDTITSTESIGQFVMYEETGAPPPPGEISPSLPPEGGVGPGLGGDRRCLIHCDRPLKSSTTFSWAMQYLRIGPLIMVYCHYIFVISAYDTSNKGLATSSWASCLQNNAIICDVCFVCLLILTVLCCQSPLDVSDVLG
jgi:hypothetical protein